MAQECLKKFVDGVIDIFEKEYMRRPDVDDKKRLLVVASARGFSGMLGSICCMHWAWSNCPTACHGQYARGDHGYPTIIHEAVASYDTWILRYFFGVLDLRYYLADGIYPEYATLVHSIQHPLDLKAKLFGERQESGRKDVELVFEILKKGFAYIKGPSKQFHQDEIGKNMKTCIIMHNMIVKANRDTYSLKYVENDLNIDNSIDERLTWVIQEVNLSLRNAILKTRDVFVTNPSIVNLMEHIWNREHGPN